MLVTAAAILLCLLLRQLEVNGLITTHAKCLSGYEWMFSSKDQSPCDVAAELASVCTRPFNLEPLPVGYIYSTPTVANQNGCRCSSVYYSLMSGCSYCQGRDYRRWLAYVTNCSIVHLTVYPFQIPDGVRVPAYAYQDVSISGTFNVTLAYSVRGVESSGSPSSNTQTPTPTPSTAGDGSNNDGIAKNSPQIVINTHANTPAIVGGVVGGVVGLGLIGALITFIVLRSKRKLRSQNNSGSQQSSNMAFSSTPTASLIPSTTSGPPPGSPGSAGFVHNANDRNTNPLSDPNIYVPHKQHSPPLFPNAVTRNSSSHNFVPPRTMPQNPGGLSYYTGRPEV